MTAQSGPNPYLKTKVMTASPQELRLMLYDGAIRFCHQAKAGITEGDFERSYTNLTKVQKIVLELSNSLDRKMIPELSQQLGALYVYIYKLLVQANTDRQLEPLDEAIQLLGYERETWAMLMEKLRSGEVDEADLQAAQAAQAQARALQADQAAQAVSQAESHAAQVAEQTNATPLAPVAQVPQPAASPAQVAKSKAQIAALAAYSRSA